MDDTPTEELLAELETLDPAEAPDAADAVAARLAEELETDSGAQPAPPA